MRFLALLSLGVALSAVATTCLHAQEQSEEASAEVEPGYVALFDGETLEGWEGDSEHWSVEDGVIVGSSEETPVGHNTFLCTIKKYADFVLKLEFRLVNHNSGVQIRSRHVGGALNAAGEMIPSYVVRGYQADIAEQRYMGILYEERGRGILADVDPEEVAKHYKPGEWNEYEIICKGPRIQLLLNGYQTVDYTEKDADAGAESGIIALQLHQGPPMRVEFRNIRIKELKGDAEGGEVQPD